MKKIKILIQLLRIQKKDDIYLNERLKFRSKKPKCSSHIQTREYLPQNLTEDKSLTGFKEGQALIWINTSLMLLKQTEAWEERLTCRLQAQVSQCRATLQLSSRSRDHHLDGVNWINGLTQWRNPSWKHKTLTAAPCRSSVYWSLWSSQCHWGFCGLYFYILKKTVLALKAHNLKPPDKMKLRSMWVGGTLPITPITILLLWGIAE